METDAVGRTGPETLVSWDRTDVMLYALSVGAGQDPLTELHLTTENTDGVNLQALPTFALVLAQRSLRPTVGGWDPVRAVHGHQSLTLHQELPVAGSARIQSKVVAVEDKRSGALITIETTAHESDSGKLLFTCAAGNFVRGAGGFDPEGLLTRPAERWSDPTATSDVAQHFSTHPNQALLYRLNVDRNPLHSDPAFAIRAGFARPILHGICTYGFTARSLIHLLCDNDPAHMTAISARFTRSVAPGERLTVHAWLTDETSVRFRTLFEDGTPAVDHGIFTYNPLPSSTSPSTPQVGASA